VDLTGLINRLQCGFVFWAAGSMLSGLSRDESDLIAGYERQLLRHTGVDLVADYKEASSLDSLPGSGDIGRRNTQ